MFTPATDWLRVIAGTALLHAGPYTHQVVVASAGQVSSVRGPLQPAYFLRVTVESEDVMVCHPHVMMVNVSRPWATRGGEKPHYIIWAQDNAADVILKLKIWLI